MTLETHTNESELIAKAASGDVSAFESLYRTHSARVYGLCLRLTGREAEAQDCAQEAFIKAWRQLSGFRGDSSLGSWLHRIAVNVVRDKRRREHREENYLALVASTAQGPADLANEADAVAELERAIRHLPTRARDVFVLHRIYGYTHEQVAQMLDIAVGTSKAQVHRAVQLLSAALPAIAASFAAGERPARNGNGARQ